MSTRVVAIVLALFALHFTREAIIHVMLMSTGVFAALLGAIVGGVFTLLGSTWVQAKQLKHQANMRKKETIYRPLYDELMKIHGHILVKAPFPSHITFNEGAHPSGPYPQYNVWSEIKLDSRKLEIPENLATQMEELRSNIEEYLKIRHSPVDEVVYILNEIFDENGQPLDRSVRAIVEYLLPSILQNSGEDIYKLVTQFRKHEEIDEETREKINNAVFHKCNESEQILHVRKKYEKYLETQKEAIDMLEVLIRAAKY
ncbi:MAG: hypothetical protein FWC76_00430 [Defluviitaleaceae bacterium]|nr:hypothetical protein [Defluviitaleaceae bacterium]